MVVTPGVASARSNPFSFTTIPMISGGSFVAPACPEPRRASCRLRSDPICSLSREALNLDITSSLSAICLTCFGETKLTASMWRNPANTSSFRYSALYSVGICSGSPCHASLGHSMSFTVSMRPREPEEVESSKLKVEVERRKGLSWLCFDLLAQAVEHSRKFSNVFESHIGSCRGNVAQV